MMRTMCAELSPHAQTGAAPEQRRRAERLRRAAPLIRADIKVYQYIPVVSASGPLAEHIAVHTLWRSDAG
jgi:hypothetical protein